MEIDLKRTNDNIEYISTETSTKYDVNKLRLNKSVDALYLMKDNDSSLTKITETELKSYFTKNKNELISILHEAIGINKNDFLEYYGEIVKNYINSKIPVEFNSGVVKFIKEVNVLPDTGEQGGIYCLNDGTIKKYFIYINNSFFAIMDKEFFEENFYKKETLNLKLNELNSKLNEMVNNLDTITNNSITDEDLNSYIEKLNQLKDKLSSISNN